VVLTSSSSRSIAEAERALMIEPLSDSMEEDIFPAPRRSVGLEKKDEGLKIGRSEEDRL
jgi:hypothetical protein